jgi:hypothetical protein
MKTACFKRIIQVIYREYLTAPAGRATSAASWERRMVATEVLYGCSRIA